MVFNRIRVVNVLDKNAGKLDIVIISLLAGGQFELLINAIFVGHKIFVNVVEVDIVLHLIDDEGDSSQSFVEVVIVSDITDGV